MLPETHSDCLPIRNAQTEPLTHDEAMQILREECYKGPVYFGVGEFIEVDTNAKPE